MPTVGWGPMLVMVLLLAVGCSEAPAPPPVTTTVGNEAATTVSLEPTSPAGPPPSRTESGTAEVYGTNVEECHAWNEVVADHHWEFIPLESQAGDASLAIHLEWQAVNPTANEVRLSVRDREGPSGPVLYDQWGPSPQDLVLFKRDLAAFNDTMYLQVGLDGCRGEALGLHAVRSDQPQPVDWALDWNTLSDQ
ncbi:MAG TPA: hypothetical protein VM327_06245 [Candidatus Thermoplasmatota archaeon]|nr:hypothetical protein [Candidatus Thermoplasmatota archaeon]